MDRLRSHKWIFWTLVIAYVALLAHAFVPHHHHNDQTAFINLKACPHGHHGDGGMHGHYGDGNMHGHPAAAPSPFGHQVHQEHQPGDPLPHSAAGDCETLKNILLTDHQLDEPGAVPTGLLFYTDLSYSIRLPEIATFSVFAGSRLRWEPTYSPGIYYESAGLRGPPALA